MWHDFTFQGSRSGGLTKVRSSPEVSSLMTDAGCWGSAMQQPRVVDELKLVVAFMQLTVFFSGDKHHGLWLNHAHTAKIQCPLPSSSRVDF